MKKIDCHIHITPPDLIRDFKKIGEREPYFDWLSNTPHNRFATGEEVIDMLQKEGFQHGIVFGFAFNDPALCRYVNDYTMEIVKRYPELLSGFMVVSPNDLKMADEIERCVKGGLIGIGELFPEGQGWQLETCHETLPLGAMCKHYDLPLLLHTNETVGHSYAGKTKTSLKAIETFISHHPLTPIILAHFGGGMLFYETMKELRERFKNVYYDCAAGIFLYESSIYKVAQTIGIFDKLVFGSDFPLLSPSRYTKMLEEAQLSEEDMKKLYSSNLEKILRV